jgi:hypothetical protein
MEWSFQPASVARIERSEIRGRCCGLNRRSRISLRSIRATALHPPLQGEGRGPKGRGVGCTAMPQRIFFRVKVVLRRLAMGEPRKFNGSRIRNARFSVAYGRASGQFHCCLTHLPHPLTGASSRPRKGRQPVTPTDGAGAVPAGGGSSLLLSGGPGIDPAGITTGARGASLKRGAEAKVTPSRCIA